MDDILFKSEEEIDFWIQTVYIPFIVKDVLDQSPCFNIDNDMIAFSQELFTTVENKKKKLIENL